MQRDDRGLQRREVSGPAAVVDVVAVGRIVDDCHLRAEFGQDPFGNCCRSAVGQVRDHTQAFEIAAGETLDCRGHMLLDCL